MSVARPETAGSETAEAAPENLWHNQDFLKFWAGETLSLFGTQVTNLALPLTAVLIFKASAQAVGLLKFLQLAPYLFLALIFGVLVDRGRRKPIMLAANLVRMLLIALVPVLAHYHHLSITGLLVISCAVGIFSVLFDVSWMAFVPALVRDAKHYVEANQKLGVTQSSADVAGPGLAGVLVGWLTAPTALIVDSASYLISIVSLLWIRTPEPPPPGSADRRLIAELRDGVRWVYGDRILRPLALVAPFTNFSMMSVWTLFLLYGVRTRGLSPATVGLIFSVSSLGALFGAMISRRLIRRYRVGLLYGISLSSIFAAPLLIPFATGPRPVLIGMFILSFVISYLGLGVAGVVMISLRQIRTPQSLMGRMNAAFRTVLYGGGSLGSLCAGLLGGALGPRAALAIIAVGSACMVIGIAVSPVTRLAELPEPITDPVEPQPSTR